jgi:hypothetical protein
MFYRWLVLVVAAAISFGAGDLAAALDEARESESGAAGFQVAPRERPKLTPWRIFPAAGQFRVDAFVFGSLESESDFVTLSPDLWYGVGDGVALGLVHSGYGSHGFWGLPGGICLNDCNDEIYDNVGVRTLARLHEGDFRIAADAGVLVDLIGTTEVGLRAGVASQFHRSWIRVELNPTVLIALNERSSGANDFLLLPVTVGFVVTPELRFDVQSGYLGPIQDFGDTWSVPITVGGAYDWHEHLRVGLRVSYFEVSGDHNPSSLEFFVSIGR